MRGPGAARAKPETADSSARGSALAGAACTRGAFDAHAGEQMPPLRTAPARPRKRRPTSASETSTPAGAARQGSEPFDGRRSAVRADQLLRLPCERGKATPAGRAGRASTRARRRAARTKTSTSFSPAKNAAADPASAAASDQRDTARKRSRLKWSPNEAAKGATSAAGSRRTSPAIPTATVPPELYAKTPSATKCAHSAVIAAPQASSRRRMFRLRKTATSPASA